MAAQQSTHSEPTRCGRVNSEDVAVIQCCNNSLLRHVEARSKTTQPEKSSSISASNRGYFRLYVFKLGIRRQPVLESRAQQCDFGRHNSMKLCAKRDHGLRPNPTQLSSENCHPAYRTAPLSVWQSQSQSDPWHTANT